MNNYSFDDLDSSDYQSLMQQTDGNVRSSQSKQLSENIAIALSMLGDFFNSLVKHIEAKDKTIQQLQQEIGDLKEKNRELQGNVKFWESKVRAYEWEPNAWDNDGSSNADCQDRDYGSYRLGS